jgi:uncharacterized protein
MARRLAGESGGKLSGETDLDRLIATMRPQLDPDRYAFRLGDVIDPNVFAMIREEEGMTVITPDPVGEWARITLTVHSSLNAVGLTAAFARALADARISANVIAGLHHDHIFVPWPRRDDAMAVLCNLSGTRA